VDNYEIQRQELAHAEVLFDLPVTVYHELIQVQKELKGQEQIYIIYEEQKVYTAAVIFLFVDFNFRLKWHI